MSRGLRHVVAPPSAGWHHAGGLRDAASPYAHKVHFMVHTLQDSSRKQGDRGERAAPFDMETFREQVSRLALPHQSFTFAASALDLLDDPALATALSVTTRAGLAELPTAATPSGRSHDPDVEALFIDSHELAAHIRRRFNMAPRRDGAMDAHATLEVPIFILSLDSDRPLLLDSHHNARSLEDMVLVVDNAASQDEHPTGFMCEGSLLSRPLSPLRHALAAVLQHLGGVLPPHLGYNPGRGLVAHDWLWSVGAHPLSWTSTGTAYSQLHIDALHRSYIFDALDRSIDDVNAGVSLLADEKPDELSHARVVRHREQLLTALKLYSQAAATWRGAVAHASALEFGAAARMIPGMERAAAAFLEACQQVDATLHPQRCADRAAPIAPSVLRAIVGGSCAAVALALLLTCGTARRKTKAG
ncbi:hypothetical protein MNEG_1854 [Monoraphidium neglectum]|uniref:Uncharacterized protein n=1 Tax=Monoraphidium neglectum TaxID=145388 RepID=A0A0D2LI05_9CHLO|nr:hypothetical protein MNEG_1854 [Monoraphidium neglectum]KIZ06099.1 hypothetical protein MNEG_1854 [Monoraphidium neglectum]|eukprot:XP_013905118.1 hypothetical protein MNEG_1854 [Monoraphidium neglectum]